MQGYVRSMLILSSKVKQSTHVTKIFELSLFKFFGRCCFSNKTIRSLVMIPRSSDMNRPQ